MSEEAAATPEFCALCGDVIPAGKAQFVIEGSACEKCAAARAAAKARKLMPAALFAVLAALVPLFISYATTHVSDGQSVTTITSTRILFYSSSSSNSLDFHVDGVAPAATERTYSDPVAVAFGATALLLGALGAWLALRAKNRNSIVASGVAAAFGVFHLLHGLGKI